MHLIASTNLALMDYFVKLMQKKDRTFYKVRSILKVFLRLQKTIFSSLLD